MEKRCKNRCLNDKSLCDSCARKLRFHLAELPELVVAVELSLGAKQGLGERITGSREAPIPVRIDAISWVGPAAPNDHITDLHHDQAGPVPLLATISSWASLIADSQNIKRPLPTIQLTLKFLRTHTEWTTCQPWSADYATEIQQHWRIGRALAGIRPPVQRIGVPCPRCNTLTMTRNNDSQRYECTERSGGCGTRWTHDEWQTHTIRRLNHTAA